MAINQNYLLQNRSLAQLQAGGQYSPLSINSGSHQIGMAPEGGFNQGFDTVEQTLGDYVWNPQTRSYVKGYRNHDTGQMEMLNAIDESGNALAQEQLTPQMLNQLRTAFQTGIPVWMQTEEYANLPFSERRQSRRLNNLSPLNFDQYLAARSAIDASPEADAMDMYGRVILPGSKVYNANKSGYWEYAPPVADVSRGIKARNLQPIGFEPVQDYDVSTTNLGNIQNWKWNATQPGARGNWRDDMRALLPDVENGGTLGQGGWNAIQGIVSTAAPGIQMLSPVAGGIIKAAQGAQSAYNASQSGDTTGAVLGGISSVAGAGGAQGTQSLANLAKSINNYYNSGNVAALSGAIGALSNLYSGYNQYQAGQPAETAGGGNMDEYNLNTDMGDYSLNTDLGDAGYINPAGSVGDGGGGWGGWFDSLNWEKIIPTALGLGLTAYGQVNNASANSAAQQAAARAQQMQQSGADSALNLAREQFEYQKQLNQPFYNRGLQGFDQYASAITGTPMANGKTWSPTETPAYQWQQQQQDKNLGRTLRSLGRSNSTYGMNVRADANRNLAASEYDRQLNRLASLTDVARGGAASLGNASSNYGNTAGNISLTSGENQANAALASGLMNINNANQNTRNLYSLADLGLKAWNTGG